MKTNDILKQVLETKSITEQQIKLLCRRMNAGEKIDVSIIWDNEIRLTSDQNNKGYAWLLNKWKTPRGIERKNNPFGYREERVLETFTHFELRGFYDTAKYNQMSYWIPLYLCCGSDGCFEYYMQNGEPQIIG